jgi:hypothetical protein
MPFAWIACAMCSRYYFKYGFRESIPTAARGIHHLYGRTGGRSRYETWNTRRTFHK